MKILMEPCHFEINITRKHNQILSKTSKFTDHLKCLFLIKECPRTFRIIESMIKNCLLQKVKVKKVRKREKENLIKRIPDYQ